MSISRACGYQVRPSAVNKVKGAIKPFVAQLQANESGTPRSLATSLAVNDTPKSRIGSVDLIRGAVMILMEIDHVRVYSSVPPGGPTPGVFFTRWVTHFRAPAFIFFRGEHLPIRSQARRQHVTVSTDPRRRLIFLEFTLLRLAWTFNFDFRLYEMAGVIWVIGACMILMAGLVKLPLAAVVDR